MKTSVNKDRKIVSGIAHIFVSFNNTIITFTDVQGYVISWSSAGTNGFKGSRKSTPYAAQVAADVAARSAMDRGLKTVQVVVKGPGVGRDSAVRAIALAGITITSIKDITPVAHNGCRRPKRRRV